MSEVHDASNPSSVGGGARRPAGQPAGRARRVTPRVIVAVLLVVLALWAVVILRSRTTLALGKPCGSFFSGRPGTPTSPAVTQDDISCFVQAHTRCSAASLDTTVDFGDGSTQSTFVVAPGQGANGTCGLVIQWRTQGTVTGSGQEQCSGLTQQGDVLTFHACGTLGDVQVPPGP